MTIWNSLARAATAAGDDILLRQRGDIYEIRFNGIELMSNLNCRSETILAERTLRMNGTDDAHVLIGGLGMGFTLRTALDCLGPRARVTVCELIADIAEWNRSRIGHLAGHPLRDPRVGLREDDVLQVLLESPAAFDVILMDTDNGPDFTVRPTNDWIYSGNGLVALRRALRPGGLAAFWSATVSPDFERRLDAQPWFWRREDVPLFAARADAFHHIYLASGQAGRIGLPDYRAHAVAAG